MSRKKYTPREGSQVKVLLIVTAYERHPGDLITPWLVETIRRLREEDVHAEVLAPAYRGLASGTIGGVNVHRFRYAPRRWEDLTHDQTAPDRVRERPAYLALVPGYVALGMRAARRLARTGGYDLIAVHWPIPHALMGLAAARGANLPLALHFHGVELTWAQGQLAPMRPLLRYLIRAADGVTANSTYTAAMIRRVYDRPVERIPFGATIDAGSTGPGSVKPAHAPFELLFVGRLVERKGVHVLLDALAEVRRTHAVRLIVVGGGPMRGALEEQSARLELTDAVTFAGVVPAADLAERFARCDAFVLPAVVDSKGDTEGFGVVLVEAMSFGKPAIASAAGGIVDVVRPDESGVLVPPGDVHALAGAIRNLAADSARAAALGQGGRELVQREFAWPVIVGRLAAFYRSLVERAADR